MSHTTKINAIEIRDVAAVAAAIKDMIADGKKLELIANAKPRAYFNNQNGMGQADFVVKLHNAPYDLGLYKQEDGSYEIRTDFWAGKVERELGVKPFQTPQQKLGQFYQAYSTAVVMNKLKASGKMVSRIKAKDGSVKLVAQGY